MAFRNLSYQAEFGIALHETGLNGLSAGLRAARPELFAISTDIPIIRPSAGNPGHLLTLYAVADEPIAFNLYPVESTPGIQQDGFFIASKILFTLTDSRLGSITRIEINVEAAGQLVRTSGQLKVALLRKSDGTPWFDIVRIEGDHPAPLQLLDGRIEGVIDAEGKLLPDGDEETARSFRAIMNYLITLFLKEGLTRVVTEFPMPSLADLVDAGPLGKLPGRDLFVRNDAVYLTLGGGNPGPGGFPAPFPRSDIALGVSERGLQRIMDAMSAMPININLGDDNTSFRVRSSNFGIRKIRTNLLPGSDHLLGQVFFGGTLEIRLQFKAFDKWVRTPWLPLPIDDTFSQYAGLIRPYLKIVDQGTPNEKLELRMEPDSRFLELWIILIVTDYRGHFRDVFRRLVNSVKEQLIYKKLKKIPIIGWIVDFILDVTSEVLAWALGAALDTFMSATLTGILNTVGRIALQFMKRQEFVALKIEQSTVKALTGLTLRSGILEQLEDGRGGELFLGLSFEQGQFPVPPAPTPIPAEPAPQPIPEPPAPGPTLPSLREYGASEFQPAFLLPLPNWQNGAREEYTVEVSGSRSISGTMKVQYEQVQDGWRITKRLQIDHLPGVSVAVAEYDSNGNPVRASYRQELAVANDQIKSEFTQTVDLSGAGSARTSISLGPLASFERTVPVMARDRLELDEFWPFRLAHADLSDGMAGVFGRMEFADPTEFENWSRQIPVSLKVDSASLPAPAPESSVNGLIVSANDEDGRIRIVIDPAAGILEMEVHSADGKVSLRRR